jgi:polyphenol oxidase
LSFHERSGLKYFSFDIFKDAPLKQGLFTRKGGISPEQWSSLNLGGTNGDSRANVIENRKRIFQVMDRDVESIFDVWQVHGTETVCTDRPRPLDSAHQQADIILTDRPEITLFMRFADCVPIFLYDPEKRVIGIVHAGWQGTVKKAPAVAVQRMVSAYGCRAENILAGIGPSIGAHHYQVGDDVVHRARGAFKEQADEVLIKRDGVTYFDLWKANRISLNNEGVQSVEIAGLCTACNIEDWYSHRAEAGKTGRFGALLAMC